MFSKLSMKNIDVNKFVPLFSGIVLTDLIIMFMNAYDIIFSISTH